MTAKWKVAILAGIAVLCSFGTYVALTWGDGDESRALFEEVALGEELVEFLTLPAYEHLD